MVSMKMKRFFRTLKNGEMVPLESVHGVGWNERFCLVERQSNSVSRPKSNLGLPGARERWNGFWGGKTSPNNSHNRSQAVEQAELSYLRDNAGWATH